MSVKLKASRRRAVAGIGTLGTLGAISALPSVANGKSLKLPAGAVIRVSRGRFDPARFDEVDAMIRATSKYLVPAIKTLPGLIAYYAGTSRDGLTTQVSIWSSEDAGKQMASLVEMRDRARGEAEALNVAFDPIVQYPISWSI
jgi:hypothetical protein